jgi:hypothetical protein
METRNIYDYQGVLIGTLSLPDNTPEETWTFQLAAYAEPPQSVTNQWIKLRADRAALFEETRWIRERQQDENTLNYEVYQEWLAYWQALRDLDLSNTENRDPFTILFPRKPE